jgi:hypothetical protein
MRPRSSARKPLRRICILLVDVKVARQALFMVGNYQSQSVVVAHQKLQLPFGVPDVGRPGDEATRHYVGMFHRHESTPSSQSQSMYTITMGVATGILPQYTVSKNATRYYDSPPLSPVSPCIKSYSPSSRSTWPEQQSRKAAQRRMKWATDLLLYENIVLACG